MYTCRMRDGVVTNGRQSSVELGDALASTAINQWQ